MKKLFFAITAFLYVFAGYAQTYYNPYQDFTQGGTYPQYSNSLLRSYWGEYQWFFRNIASSEGYINWLNVADSISWKIEVLSFPFVPNQDRTEQFTPHTKRIFTNLSDYTSETNMWSWIQNIWRMANGRAPSSINNTINSSITINSKTTLASAYFNIPDSFYTSSERTYLPHSILKHTLYAYCYGSVTPSDSLQFIIDHTRGRMNHYPFTESNFSQSGGIKAYDITVFHKLLNGNNYGNTSNEYETLNYFPLEEADSCSIPIPTSDQDTILQENGISQYYIRPTPYALSAFELLNESGKIPPGYDLDTILTYREGIPHTYILDTFLDVSVINPSERLIYNPSRVIVEADSFVFPTGYTFLTARGVYPTASEVANSPHCPDASLMDERKVIVPTDLDTSEYVVTGHLYLQPCVAIYDAKIIVDSGGTLTYDPDNTYGNFVIVDSGGTFDTSAGNNVYCNNCACIQEYYDKDAINTTINTNQTWTTDRTIGGLIEVPWGKSLTIRNCTLQFADSERLNRKVGIRVLPGGKLVLDNAHLTVLACDNMWDGIEIWGKRNADQITTQQGMLEMTHSTVSHARIGVAVGEFDHCPDTVRGGGMITVDSSTFLDNYRSIVFDPYEGYKTGRKSLSIIKNTRFLATRLLRDQTAYPHIGTERFVQLRQINGVQLLGNHFESTNAHLASDTLLPLGIVAQDATFILSEGDTVTTFKNLLKGIDAYRSGRYFQRTIIQHAVFDSVIQGITMRTGLLEHITHCDFTNIRPALALVPQTSFGYYVDPERSRYGWGIYLMDVVYPTVAYNTFERMAEGTYNFDCYGLIGNQMRLGELSYNTFTDLDIAIQTEYDNRRVRLGCNEHTNNQTAWSINPTVDIDGHFGIGPSRLGDQGEGCDVGEKTAGNLFGTGQCANGKEVLITDTTSFNYYGHGFHASTTVPDTTCSNKQQILIEACERLGNPNDWCPDITDPLTDTFPYPLHTAKQLVDLIEALDEEYEKQQKLSEILGQLIDIEDLDLAIEVLDTLTFTDARREKAWFHLSNGDTATAGQIADDLFTEDSTANQYFRGYIRFAGDYIEADNPCSLPTDKEPWLRGLANTGAETAFGAEAVLAAADDEVLHPTPLQWNHEAGKRSRDAKLLPSDLPEDVWAWPNPARHSLFVQVDKAAQFVLTDVNGKVVLTQSLQTGVQTINISTIPSGFYIGSILLDNGTRKYTSIIVGR